MVRLDKAIKNENKIVYLNQRLFKIKKKVSFKNIMDNYLALDKIEAQSSQN